MNITSLVITLLLVALGVLQAWDSNVLHAGNLVLILVGAAIAIAAGATLFPSRPGLLLGASVSSVLLLIVARIVSPIPLPAILTICPIICVALFAVWQVELRRFSERK